MKENIIVKVIENGEVATYNLNADSSIVESGVISFYNKTDTPDIKDLVAVFPLDKLCSVISRKYVTA